MSEPHETTNPGASRPEPPALPIDASSRALEEAFRSSFAIVRIVMILLVVIFAFSGVKTVGPQEKAVILRFGKPVGTGPEQLLGPGFHWACPYPIDEVVPIPVGQSQTIVSTVGWYATTAVAEAAGTEPPPAPSLNPAADGYVLTADGNILHVRATMHYHITDPLAYIFDYVNVSNNILSVLNNAIVCAAAGSSVDDALLNNAGFKERVLARVNDQIDSLKLGITLDPSDVNVIAPRYVKSDFDAVLAAGEDKGKTILTAQGYAETAVRQAQARANSLVGGAEAESARFVREVQADANSFTNQLPQYLVNPYLFRQRILTETWQRVLARANDKFFLPEREGGKSRELRLLLNREPPKIKNDSTAPR